MTPLFGDAGLVHHHDAVRVLDRREAVGDDEGRPSDREFGERSLDRPLGLGVERARRLVQDEDGRVLEEHPRDRHALLLPAGELHAALAHHRRHAVGKARDHVVEPRPARRLGDLLVRGVEPPVGDIVPDRAAEEEHVLLDDTDVPPQGGERHVAHVDAVDRDPPRVQLVEAGKQRADRGLARAAGADERDGLARVQAQVDAVEHATVPPRSRTPTPVVADVAVAGA